MASGREHIDLKPLALEPHAKDFPPEHGLSDPNSKLIEIFEPAVNQLSPAEVAGEGLADDIAKQVDELYPVGKGGRAAESFFYYFWTFFINVVRRIPAADGRAELLFAVVKNLVAKDRGEVEVWDNDVKVWADLPLLGPNMREAWNTTPDFARAETQGGEDVASWTSLNAFAARVLGEGLMPWSTFAIWWLRTALEEPPAESIAGLEGQLSASCKWIVHAGKALYEGGRSGQALDDSDRRVLRGGKLFDGPPGLNGERWSFWRQRFEDLGKRVESEELRKEVEEVIGKMKALAQ